MHTAMHAFTLALICTAAAPAMAIAEERPMAFLALSPSSRGGFESARVVKALDTYLGDFDREVMITDRADGLDAAALLARAPERAPVFLIVQTWDTTSGAQLWDARIYAVEREYQTLVERSRVSVRFRKKPNAELYRLIALKVSTALNAARIAGGGDVVTIPASPDELPDDVTETIEEPPQSRAPLLIELGASGAHVLRPGSTTPGVLAGLRLGLDGWSPGVTLSYFGARPVTTGTGSGSTEAYGAELSLQRAAWTGARWSLELGAGGGIRWIRGWAASAASPARKALSEVLPFLSGQARMRLAVTDRFAVSAGPALEAHTGTVSAQAGEVPVFSWGSMLLSLSLRAEVRL